MDELPIVTKLKSVRIMSPMKSDHDAVKQAAALIRAQNAALERAKQFIVNGVEYGYIRMPDPSTPDSAHDTLPAITAALAKAREA